jgi:predicted membrane chloride channel (bestrophin family)
MSRRRDCWASKAPEINDHSRPQEWGEEKQIPHHLKTKTGGSAMKKSRKYDPDETCCLALKFTGTVWPSLIRRPLIWLSILVYSVAHILRQYANGDDYLPRVDRKVMVIPAGLISFLVVFFLGECYKRFTTAFENCKKIGGSIRNITMLVKTIMKHDKAQRDHVVRLCVLAMHRTFRTLSTEQFQFVGGEDVEAEIFFRLDHAVNELHWCTPAERAALDDFRDEVGTWSDQPLVCISWANDILQENFAQGKITKSHVRSVEDQFMQLRAACSSIQSHFQCPIPLPYWHMLNCLCNLFSFFFSYGMSFVDTWCAWCTAFIFIVGILGLREVGIMMAEPFGDDDCDINVKGLTKGTFTSCYVLLETTRPEKDDVLLEKTWSNAVAAAGLRSDDEEVEAKTKDETSKDLSAELDAIVTQEPPTENDALLEHSPAH